MPAPRPPAPTRRWPRRPGRCCATTAPSCGPSSRRPTAAGRSPMAAPLWPSRTLTTRWARRPGARASTAGRVCRCRLPGSSRRSGPASCATSGCSPATATASGAAASCGCAWSATPRPWRSPATSCARPPACAAAGSTWSAPSTASMRRWAATGACSGRRSARRPSWPVAGSGPTAPARSTGRRSPELSRRTARCGTGGGRSAGRTARSASRSATSCRRRTAAAATTTSRAARSTGRRAPGLGRSKAPSGTPGATSGGSAARWATRRPVSR